ncbi:MAG: adenine phosphoribosyltransferase [Tissierellia bacterium]|nr:adenine phosphoribosyltransferase [Tissierellia bacterium]
MNLENKIRSIVDYPKKGIIYRDITTLLKDKDGLHDAVDTMIDAVGDKDVDLILGIEARGFIFGTPMAYEMDCGFVPVRKAGKLPAETVSKAYDLEYGTDTIEIHKDAILPGQKVLIVDDLLATGGTAKATADIVEQLGGVIVGFLFLIELEDLNGREVIGDYNIESIIKY